MLELERRIRAKLTTAARTVGVESEVIPGTAAVEVVFADERVADMEQASFVAPSIPSAIAWFKEQKINLDFVIGTTGSLTYKAARFIRRSFRILILSEGIFTTILIDAWTPNHIKGAGIQFPDP